ncbi:MAG: ABC transporter permease [Lachnospiraceae bacterium]|nr:ABC transporter permease [Butyrivibrio sp.]MCM1343421.1 ABC transporter permease [Muribaculaceae bacterium]MCM1412228.1 ABC transporter permease [Lachnospiraceae bacterium]
MREILYLAKRNSLVYLRDRKAVFFSILSMLIVLGLMVIFLGSMNSENLVLMLEQYGGARDAARDAENAKHLIQLWTLAGILIVNSVTITLTVIGIMVQDEEQSRLASFYVTPVKRGKLVLGYVLAAWLTGACLSILTLAAGELYMVARGWGLLPVSVLAAMCGMIFLNTFVYAALGYLLAMFIHSYSAWGGMLTIVGTLVGFAGGIYLPMSAFSERLQTVLKCLPVLQGISLMRRVCLEGITDTTFQGMPSQAVEIFQEDMGVTLTAGERIITIKEQLFILLLYGIIAICIAVILNKGRRLKDRTD